VSITDQSPIAKSIRDQPHPAATDERKRAQPAFPTTEKLGPTQRQEAGPNNQPPMQQAPFLRLPRRAPANDSRRVTQSRGRLNICDSAQPRLGGTLR